jgi:hypothetical protein
MHRLIGGSAEQFLGPLDSFRVLNHHVAALDNMARQEAVDGVTNRFGLTACQLHDLGPGELERVVIKYFQDAPLCLTERVARPACLNTVLA